MHVQEPPTDDVLDATSGLALAANNERLYRQLLQLFVDHHGGAACELHRLADADDGAALQRIAHSLKGSAGQIGARNLQRSAGEVEQSLRDGGGMALQQQLTALHRDLAHLFSQLRAHLGHATH